MDLVAELKKSLSERTEVPLPKLRRLAAERIEVLEGALAMAVAAITEMPDRNLRTVHGSRTSDELRSYLEKLLEGP